MKVRISPSVINFKDKLLKAWKLKEWEGIDDPDKELLFFGMYLKIDYDVYRLFKGKKYVFWCGGDLVRLRSNYDWQRILRLYPETEHYVENELEQKELEEIGIKSKIVPSFLDDIEKYPVCYKPSENPHIFLSAHPNREEEYGILLVERIAPKLPNYTFHIYGVYERYGGDKPKNVLYHGIVPEGQMNKEIQNYQCGLRPNEHDGNSEITMKCLLNGGYPITRIKYPKIWHYETEEELIELLEKLPRMKKPNIEAREYWIKKLNKFPWVK